MSKENRIAFEKFDDHLRLRQKEGVGDPDFDFREWIIDNRYAAWNIGYVASNLSQKYGANLKKLFPNALSLDDSNFGNSSHHLIFGTIYDDAKVSHIGGVRALQTYQPGTPLIFGEQGFLATSHSWSQALRGNDPKLACLGYVYDDISYYFMADYPNRLIHRLNSDNALSDEDLARARSAMARIVEKKISKYNSQPIASPTMADGYQHRVMVCDQAFADASTIYGKLTENDFEQMLLAAIRENPNAQILIKTHPDTHWEKGKRVGYYNHLEDTGRIRILRDPVNPYSLFDCVDKVYVGSSQMGLEALLAGKEVVCFGAPFYAGWGLTDDRQTIPHRHRKRSLEEIFYYFYIWYTIYHVPNCATPSRIEDALDFIEKHRPVQMPTIVQQACEKPKVSVILPVYGVEKFINQCLDSIRAQTLKDIEIITVNDCSPDGSQAIIDRHAAEDARIRPIVLKENVGQGFARNAGIEAARGEFIQFLDSDDFLARKEHLERVYNAAVEDNADMVRGRKIFERLENAQGKKIGLRRDWCETAFDVPFHGKTFSEKPEIIQGRHFWNWLYRREFLLEQDIRFLTPQWEEKPFLMKALLNAKSLSSIDHEGFVYRVRVNSTARREKTTQDAEYQIQNFESLVELLLDSGALNRTSDLFDVSRYLITQFLHFMIFGFVKDTIQRERGATGEQELYERLQRLLVRTGMKHTDASSAPKQLKANLKSRNAYPLIFAALLSGRFEYVNIAANLSKIPQADYVAEMLRAPENDAERQLQEALSLYARNELVTTDKDAISQGKAFGKKPKLLIHIGSTKTGSTFIQHFLEQNRAALLRAGIYVPEVGLFWQQTRPHKQAGHAQFVPEAVLKKSRMKDHVEATLALSGNQIHTVILSSEAYFLNPNAVELVRHFSDYDVEMITYLRRQDDWANSQYAEFVAGGAVGRVDQPIEEWLNSEITRNRLDYFGRMKLWETVLDRSKIHIGIYDRKQLKNGDIVSDFLSLSKLEEHADLPRPDVGQENRFPFGTAHVNLIRRLNKSNWSDRDAYFNFIEDAGQKVTQIRKQKGLPATKLNLLTDVQRQSILESVAESNANLAREFLSREDLTLFAPLVPDHKETLDVISNDEFDAIMQAYDTWLPKERKTNNKSAIKPKKQNPAKKPLYRIHDSLTYKTFSAVSSPFLSQKRLKKLKEQPMKFFEDSNSVYVGYAYKAIKWEKAKRQKAAKTNDISLLPTNKTLVVKVFNLAGQRMGTHKLAKLQSNPDQFFADMKGLGAGTVRKLLMLERRLRG
ncbi:glycosyltransferase [Loktanella sp. S4079]|uniref:glycosyltransferase n=1 Tax=Loktanella sp. S4079 TaxID=579483 RepID=UPI0006991693|nr:glycosyltransferase [Loktanella sp. S4079]